jgi:hypothetical protein
MPHYQSAEVRFNVPDGWQDCTIVSYAAPAKPGRAITPNLVVTRDAADGREPVTAYADRQLVEFAKRLDGFALKQRKERTLGGLPAVELVFTWDNPLGVLQQKQVCVLVGRRTMLNFTLSAAEEDFAGMEPGFDTILGSLRFPETPGWNPAPAANRMRY